MRTRSWSMLCWMSGCLVTPLYSPLPKRTAIPILIQSPPPSPSTIPLHSHTTQNMQNPQSDPSPPSPNPPPLPTSKTNLPPKPTPPLPIPLRLPPRTPLPPHRPRHPLRSRPQPAQLQLLSAPARTLPRGARTPCRLRRRQTHVVGLLVGAALGGGAALGVGGGAAAAVRDGAADAGLGGGRGGEFGGDVVVDGVGAEGFGGFGGVGGGGGGGGGGHGGCGDAWGAVEGGGGGVCGGGFAVGGVWGGGGWAGGEGGGVGAVGEFVGFVVGGGVVFCFFSGGGVFVRVGVGFGRFGSGSVVGGAGGVVGGAHDLVDLVLELALEGAHALFEARFWRYERKSSFFTSSSEMPSSGGATVCGTALLADSNEVVSLLRRAGKDCSDAIVVGVPELGLAGKLDKGTMDFIETTGPNAYFNVARMYFSPWPALASKQSLERRLQAALSFLIVVISITLLTWWPAVALDARNRWSRAALVFALGMQIQVRLWAAACCCARRGRPALAFARLSCPPQTDGARVFGEVVGRLASLVFPPSETIQSAARLLFCRCRRILGLHPLSVAGNSLCVLGAWRTDGAGWEGTVQVAADDNVPFYLGVGTELVADLAQGCELLVRHSLRGGHYDFVDGIAELDLLHNVGDVGVRRVLGAGVAVVVLLDEAQVRQAVHGLGKGLYEVFEEASGRLRCCGESAEAPSGVMQDDMDVDGLARPAEAMHEIGGHGEAWAASWRAEAGDACGVGDRELAHAPQLDVVLDMRRLGHATLVMRLGQVQLGGPLLRLSSLAIDPDRVVCRGVCSGSGHCSFIAAADRQWSRGAAGGPGPGGSVWRMCGGLGAINKRFPAYHIVCSISTLGTSRCFMSKASAFLYTVLT
ncbi:hypothetical protein FH972_023340 [Carpinus fangiana]|uniref:Uncharacterized protein n=1 Tax=Carpinus fangiana TaxID=176857 RepID=A0A5N6KUX8_9ROSI|nr:hypothetical protein FH972_023340 [Carpinus fangiana]